MKGRNDCEMLRGGWGEKDNEGAVMNVRVCVCLCVKGRDRETLKLGI